MPMPTMLLTEPPRLTGVVKFETDQTYCCDDVIVEGGITAPRLLTIGTIVGCLSAGSLSIASAVKRSGTGNGAIVNTSAPDGTLVGLHSALCIVAATNGGKFELIGPTGTVEGVVTVGTAFAAPGAPSFTIDDGTADWAVGDIIDITVAQTGTGKVVALNPSATDGSEVVYGIMVTNTYAPVGEDMPGVVLARGPATVSSIGLTYPTGLTPAQTSAINEALLALGIVILSGV